MAADTFDDAADDAMAVVSNRITQDERDDMIRHLDDILVDCARLGPGEDGKVSVAPALDYLDRLAATPGLLQWIILDWRWPIASYDAGERGIEAELAALLRAEQPTADLPLTCASPEAHRAQARRTMPTWWLRFADLLDGKPDDNAPCVVCHLPLPRSHRRNG